MEGMAPPDVEGMIFQDGAYFVPVEGGYARLPSPLDQLVTPTTPDLESSVAGLGAKTQEFLAAGDKERARESLRTARRLVHGNEAISERARGQRCQGFQASPGQWSTAAAPPVHCSPPRSSSAAASSPSRTSSCGSSTSGRCSSRLSG